MTQIKRTKTCKIINAQFSWILEVDNRSILFQGSSGADYFEKHYKKLGYNIENVDQSHEIK